jgi:hypothetical protein
MGERGTRARQVGRLWPNEIQKTKSPPAEVLQSRGTEQEAWLVRLILALAVSRHR